MKFEIKTIKSEPTHLLSARNSKAVANFDRQIEEYLADGYELIGNVRSIQSGDADSDPSVVHYVTLKKEK